MAPKLSVILPFHNTEDYIEPLLNDIRHQTFDNFECILVDNASTDSTRRICERFIKDDSRFTIVTEMSLGLSTARNTGMAIAKGDYIYFCDADDRLHPQSFEIMLNAIGDADVLYFSMQQFHKDNELRFTTFLDSLPTREIKAPLDWFIMTQPIPLCSVWSKLFKKSSLKGLQFQQDIKHAEDRYFWYELLHDNPNLKLNLLDHKIYFYRTRPGSMTQSRYNSNRIQQLDLLLRKQTNLFSDMPHRLSQMRKLHFTVLVKELLRGTQNESPELQAESARVIKNFFRDGIVRYTDFSFKWMLRLFRFTRQAI